MLPVEVSLGYTVLSVLKALIKYKLPVAFVAHLTSTPVLNSPCNPQSRISTYNYPWSWDNLAIKVLTTLRRRVEYDSATDKPSNASENYLDPSTLPHRTSDWLHWRRDSILS